MGEYFVFQDLARFGLVARDERADVSLKTCTYLGT